MVFPLYHEKVEPRSVPWVNYAIIGINLIVFLFFQQLGKNDNFTMQFSVVPEKIVTGKNLDQLIVLTDPDTKKEVAEIQEVPTPISVYLTLFTSMWMHGGILHILGNMWFLWVFGDDVENAFGKILYPILYVAWGVLASVFYVYFTYFLSEPGDVSMFIPSLGASGAIAGVLGAYIVRFPTRRVTVILFRFLTQIPAWAAVGIWFVYQLLPTLGMLGGATQAGGGVAYAAHVGGFIAGAAVMFLYNLLVPERRDDQDRYADWSQQRWQDH
jgi:membrane associated rhomboid family serine protease